MLLCRDLELSIQNERGEQKLLFENLNFKAEPGSLLMLVGKNGTGKSTLLKTLAGQLPMQAGFLSLDGRDLSSLSQKERSKDFAWVVQDNERGSIRDFTVLENLCFAQNKNRPLSIFRSALSQKRSILEFLKNNAPFYIERLSQPVSSLSGGQRQMLSVLMNLLSDAKVILLDEPTAALDEAATEDLMQKIQNCVRERQLIAMMVCHDASLVERWGDAVLDLNAWWKLRKCGLA